MGRPWAPAPPGNAHRPQSRKGRAPGLKYCLKPGARAPSQGPLGPKQDGTPQRSHNASRRPSCRHGTPMPSRRHGTPGPGACRLPGPRLQAWGGRRGAAFAPSYARGPARLSSRLAGPHLRTPGARKQAGLGPSAGQQAGGACPGPQLRHARGLYRRHGRPWARLQAAHGRGLSSGARRQRAGREPGPGPPAGRRSGGASGQAGPDQAGPYSKWAGRRTVAPGGARRSGAGLGPRTPKASYAKAGCRPCRPPAG